ncbi:MULTISPECIES: ABC transporter permease [unclassified Nocardioides]|uniref:ABC transporter permease n=1 Tax=unclassified Nocardioides TaxID=2615069 RepID=UPI0000574BC2|nr:MULTISPECIES: ABC transporter permease [unclassified Nocardioides]ABL80144.1 monosaccharide ABC transporter membrane protein, CUT2 family [Nocardioides sp. JS614]
MSHTQDTTDAPVASPDAETLPAPTGVAEAEQKRKAARARTGKARFVDFLEAYALLVLLVVIALFFCFWPETSSTFPTVANMRILLASQAVIGVISLGLLLPLLCQEFDLSVGNIAGLAAIVVAAYVSSEGNVLAAVVLALTIGLAIGAVNALIVTRLHVNGVIATLGMSTILGGIVLQRTGGLAPASDIPQSLTNFGTGLVAGVPIIFITLLVIAGITYFVLNHTSLGRQIYAVGSNMEAAKLVGLRTDGLRAVTFAAGGLLCGLGGLLYVSRAGGASPNVGMTFTLPAFAAAFLSAASVRPGRFNVWGTIIAVYFLAVLNNGLSLAGVDPYVNDYVNGGALIAGVALATVLYRRRTT